MLQSEFKEPLGLSAYRLAKDIGVPATRIKANAEKLGGEFLIRTFFYGTLDGMPIMIHRTTFALDDATATRLKRLASRLGVSQAEVVRRSVEEMERILASNKPDPTRLLRELHEKDGGLVSEEAAAYLTEVREDRKRWRGG